MFQYCLESAMETERHRFDCCLAAILRENGGYAPGGPDGPTNHGITQAAYSLWREEHFLPEKEVWQISFEEVEAIYQRDFWIPSHAEECPSPLDLLVFRCAVESGPRWAIQTLRQALGLPRGRTFCQRTRDAVKSCDGYAVSLQFLDLRTRFVRELLEKTPNQREVSIAQLDQLEKLRPALQHIGEGMHAHA